MLLCMRTSVDIPDALMDRVRVCLAKRKLTFRTLVISALENALQTEAKSFQLRDASVGAVSETEVSSEDINRAIDEQRMPSFKL